MLYLTACLHRRRIVVHGNRQLLTDVQQVGIFQAVGLPTESQGLIIAVDRVLDMCRTSVNVWSDSCGCAVVARLTGHAGE